MTTDNKEVSASPESPEAIAAQVSASAQPAAGEGEPTPAPAAEPAKAVTLADLEQALNSFQGRQSNYTADRFKKIEQTLKQEIDQALAPVRELASRAEMAQVEQLDPEEQVEYWKKKATAPAPEPSAPTAQPSQGVDTYSADDRLNIINSTTQMLVSEGVSVPYTDDRLWAGATNGMTVDQLVAVARQNAQKLKAPAPAAPAATPPSPTPPPSTQEAPAVTGASYGSRSELNAALLSGEIKDIDEFQRIGREAGILR